MKGVGSSWQWAVWARLCLEFGLTTLACLVAFKVFFGDPLPYGTLVVVPLLGLWLGTVAYRSRYHPAGGVTAGTE